MDIESVMPIVLLLSPFIVAFLLEALVIYFFKLKRFWVSLGLSVLVNLICIVVIYFVGSPLLGAMGYEFGQFNGLNLQIQVIVFLCWFSILVEGLVLQLLLPKHDKKTIYLASILMNILSFLFLHLFI